MEKRIDYKLWGQLFLFSTSITLYSIFRINLLGNLPTTTGYDIASQIAWLGTLFEILQEALILPLFFVIGKAVSNRVDFSNRIKTGLISTTLIYGIFTILILIFSDNLLLLMGKQDFLKETSQYIKLESIAILFTVIQSFLFVGLMLSNQQRQLTRYYLLTFLATLCFDFFFLGNFTLSLKLGVIGVPITKIVVAIISIIYMYLSLKKKHLLVKNEKLSFKWQKKWFNIGALSGAESFVRNMFFIFMILKMMNQVGGQSAFWLANNFIWNILLLPVLTLGEVLKKQVADRGDFRRLFKASLKITTIIIIIWLITIPLYKDFLIQVMGINEYQDVLKLILISLGFYVIFAYNNIIDSIFYGKGRTDLMLWQSILTNFLVYGFAFLLYQKDIFQPTLISIAILFGVGVVFDSLITFIMYYRFSKNALLKLK